VVKQPQAISTPLRKFRERAIIKLIKSKDISREELSTKSPRMRKSPQKSSIQGRVMAKILIRKPGKIL
jgi:hypothetical protein